MANFGRAIWLVFDRIVMALFAIIGLGLLGALAFFGPRWYESLENNRRMVGLANGLIKAELDVPYTPKFKDATVDSRIGEKAWLVVGKIVLPGQTGPRREEPYEAIMHKTCPNHSERRCWRLSGLKIGDEILLAAEVAGATNGYEVSLADGTELGTLPTEPTELLSAEAGTASILSSEPIFDAQEDAAESGAAEAALEPTTTVSRVDETAGSAASGEDSTELADAGESRPIQVLDQPLGLGVPFPPRKPLALTQAIGQGVPLAAPVEAVLPAAPTVVAASGLAQESAVPEDVPSASVTGTDPGKMALDPRMSSETQGDEESTEQIIPSVEQEVAAVDEAEPSELGSSSVSIAIDPEEIALLEPEISPEADNLQEVALAEVQSETAKDLEATITPAEQTLLPRAERLAGSDQNAAAEEDQPSLQQNVVAEDFSLSEPGDEALLANQPSLPLPAPPKPVYLASRNDGDSSIDSSVGALARVEPADRNDAEELSEQPETSKGSVEELPLPRTDPLSRKDAAAKDLSAVDAEADTGRDGATVTATRSLSQTAALGEEAQLESIGPAVERPVATNPSEVPDAASRQTTLASVQDFGEPEVVTDPASEAVYDTLETTLAASSKSVEPGVDSDNSTGSLEDLLAETDSEGSAASIEELPLPPRPIMRVDPTPFAEDAETYPVDLAEAESSVSSVEAQDSANVSVPDEDRPYVDLRSKQLAGAPPAGDPTSADLSTTDPLDEGKVSDTSRLSPAGDLLAQTGIASEEPAIDSDEISQPITPLSSGGLGNDDVGENVSAVTEPAASQQIAALPEQEVIDQAFEEESLLFLIQRRLDRLGFDPGAIRGELTLRTVTAIEDYQRSHSLPVDGDPDFALLQHLERQLRDAENLVVQDDGQQSKGSSLARDAVAARHRGDNETAIELFTRAIALGGLDNQERAAVFYNRGSAYLDRGLYDQAIFDFNESIKIDSGNGMAFNNRGSAFFQKREYQRAIDDFAQAIRLDRSDAAAYNNRGSAYHKLGEIRAAIADYDTAIRLDPNDATAYSNRGNAYFDQGHYSAAISDYDAAIRLDPNGAAAYNNRGSAYHNQKRYQEAIADYQQTLRLDPSFAVAYNNLANAYFDQDRFGEAIDAYSSAIRLSPKLHGAYFNRARAYERNKERELALLDYKMAYALDPTSEEYKSGLDEFQRKSERQNNRSWMKQLLHTSDEGQ